MLWLVFFLGVEEGLARGSAAAIAEFGEQPRIVLGPPLNPPGGDGRTGIAPLGFKMIRDGQKHMNRLSGPGRQTLAHFPDVRKEPSIQAPLAQRPTQPPDLRTQHE